MTIDTLRAKSTMLVAALAGLLALCVVASQFLLQHGIGMGSYLALAGAVILGATFIKARHTAMFRYLAVSVMMGQIMALLVATKNYPQQIDLHMAFFAALAICALLYDVKAILLGAALVAVHHLVLGMAVPGLVFFGGGGLERIVLHAVILLIEAGGLIWMTHSTVQLFSLAGEKSDQADASAAEARGLADAMQAASAARQDERQRTMAELRQDFGDVVTAAARGEFSQRVKTNFAEADLNALAQSINHLVQTVDQGLAETSTVLSALARTDLTQRVQGEYQGAFAKLRDDTNLMATKLSEVISSLRQTSGSLRTATGDLLAGANDLSERTAHQAATVVETSAAIESLSSTVSRNASRAKDAAAAAASVTDAAEHGGRVMNMANEAMERIGTSSNKISGIIGVIDDIAFQTNLLALNASVEAARAGDAGKGFAVVAVEVRRLAQSAASASSEVKVLIEQSGAQVLEGAKLVAEASSRLETILTSARSSNELMKGIAEESLSQSEAIAEVGTAVREIDKITQHNAALVEQTNAAIERTESQASGLDRVVEVFKLQNDVPHQRRANARNAA